MNSKLTIKPEIIAGSLFLLGVVLKQFYIFESGNIQAGDICFVLAFCIGCLFGLLKINRIDQYLIAFVSLTFLINGIYFFYYGEGFLLSSVYLLFNLLIVLLFRYLVKNRDFLTKFSAVLKANLIIQFLVYVLGSGRYYGGLRYKGTFNDPNQFAFFILMDFILLYMTNLYFKKKVHPIWYLLVSLSMLFSMSSGMIMAFGIFLIFTLLMPSLSKKSSSITVLSLASSFLFLLVIVFYLNSILQALGETSNWQVINSVVFRLTGKVNQFSSYTGISGFLADRGMERILTHPQYFLYGSGEGMHERFFYMQRFRLEIHSTLIGLFYYYGVIPFILFIIWVIQSLKKMPVEVYGCFIALFIETVTLTNHRQPFFWMAIVMGSFLSIEYSKKHDIKI